VGDDDHPGATENQLESANQDRRGRIISHAEGQFCKQTLATRRSLKVKYFEPRTISRSN